MSLTFHADSFIPEVNIPQGTFPFTISFRFNIINVDNIDVFTQGLITGTVIGSFSVYNVNMGAFYIGGPLFYGEDNNGKFLYSADIGLNIGQNGPNSIYDTIHSVVLSIDFTNNNISCQSVISLSNLSSDGAGIKLIASQTQNIGGQLTGVGNLYVSNTWSIPSTNPDTQLFNSITVTADNVLLVNGPLLCFLKGTKILTSDGYKNIETILPNNIVITNGKQYNIKFIFKQIMKITDVYCINENTFGESLPFSNLYLSERHAIQTPNGLEHVGCLFTRNNNEYNITKHVITNAEFYNIKLSEWKNLDANGIFAESYCDAKDVKWICNSGSCNCIKLINKNNLNRQIKMKFTA